MVGKNDTFVAGAKSKAFWQRLRGWRGGARLDLVAGVVPTASLVFATARRGGAQRKTASGLQASYQARQGPGGYAARPLSTSVRNREEDDLLLLDLPVLVEEGEPSRWERQLLPARFERRPYGQQKQRVLLVADTGDHASAAGLDGLSEFDQAIHVVVDAGEIGRIHDRLRAA